MKKIIPILGGLVLAAITIAGFFNPNWIVPSVLTVVIAVCFILEEQKKDYSPPAFWIGTLLGMLLYCWGVGTAVHLCGIDFLGQGFWSTWSYGFLTIATIVAIIIVIMLREAILGHILFFPWIREEKAAAKN